MDAWVAFTMRLLWATLLWAFMRKFLCGHVSGSLGYLPTCRVLGHLVSLHSMFWGITRMDELSHSSIGNEQGFSCPPLAATLLLDLSILAIWVAPKDTVFTCVFLMTDVAEHLFLCLLVVCIFSLEMCPLNPLPLFQLGCLSSYWGCFPFWRWQTEQDASRFFFWLSPGSSAFSAGSSAFPALNNTSSIHCTQYVCARYWVASIVLK